MLKYFPLLLLRTPLQSLQKAYNFSENIDSLFDEGLYLSSPEFWSEYQKKYELQDKNKEKMERSFHKYWLRSCMRCTPYGTFAGSALVNISDSETALELNDSHQHNRIIRIDMNYMSEIISALVMLPQIQQQIKFFINNSLYELYSTYRYVEYTIQNNTRNYHLASVEKTSYVKTVLTHAKQGATIDALAKLLVESENVEITEAKEFIVSMWQSQLLESELEPCVTGKEPLIQLIEHLELLTGIDDILLQLKKIEDLLQNAEEGVTYYKTIEQALRDVDLSVTIPKNTIQTDLFLSMNRNSIHQDLVSAILKQVEELTVLARRNSGGELESFRDNFRKKYEEAAVPLSIALDADVGIGYAGIHDQSASDNELFNGLAAAAVTNQPGSNFDYIQQYVLFKYKDYIEHKKNCIEINEEELKGFKKQVENFYFPNSMYLMGRLLSKEGRLDAEYFSFDLSSFGGPSAGNLLGRFTHGNDQLCNLTKEIFEIEEQENPSAIYAEIVHLPQARVGNVLLRPILRGYEIPYVGKSGIDSTYQIPVEDIMVRVQNNKVVLFSKKHHKQIIPRLTTAHNFSFRSLPVYKFLCDLQFHDAAQPCIWDWGNLNVLKHFPRVVYKSIIIKRAQWKVEEKDIADLPKKEAEYKKYFIAFRTKYNIPQRVIYAEHDNELLIDFEYDQGIDLFLHYLKRYKNIALEEFLFTEDNCIVMDKKGHPFTNEVIIPVQRQELAQPDKTVVITQLQQNIIQRKFSPYSEWLYFKIYCGAKTAEKILKETVLSYVEDGIGKKLFERFFFLRYRDDFSHFRIRFYNCDISKHMEVQKTFSFALNSLLHNGLIDKITLDTYSRELERYENVIEESEMLFCNDSLAVLRFINLLEDDKDEERYRLLFAMRGIDMLLDDFKFSPLQKKVLIKNMQSNFFKEFGGSPLLQKQLNEKYRNYQQFIFTHLNADKDVINGIEEAVNVFRLRSEMNKPVAECIISKLQRENSSDKLFELLPSYIHMFMNRIFITQQRKYELVVYHFLDKYYTSKIAMEQKKEVLSP